MTVTLTGAIDIQINLPSDPHVGDIICVGQNQRKKMVMAWFQF